ncbi:MAG: aromatic amino acid ammonia-lyase [Prevotellaceae bacterium]|jgi:histidine ammonia-lyase|nr:aromatic amino acid ammonia-lyase [Prevotellaceae bacterium]
MIIDNNEGFVLTQKTLENILFEKEHIVLSNDIKKSVAGCFQFLKDFASDKIIYGINTGFGTMAQYRIDDDCLTQLQYNIIRSHSAGVGNPLPDLYVRAALAARLGTFLQARSGVHLELVELLVEFINREIYPFVPEHGSVGASGDLVQLAHIALALIGEGKVHYKGEWRESAEVMRENGLQPFKIRIREGLSATNGTSVMSGIGLVNVLYAKRLLDLAILASVWINELTQAYDDGFSQELNQTKKHAGQTEVAALMREISKDSKLLQKRENKLYANMNKDEKIFKQKVQSYYSLRCVPQILGVVYDEISNAEAVIINEFNSVCDNPVIDPVSRNVLHGGNFHGDYISFEMDKLKIVITKLTMLMERQLNYLCHDRINEILPPFVNLGVLGLNYGLQAVQFTATSTTAECQTLSFPNYVHSIPNNNDNQDIVSMGTNSALIAKMVVENAFQVISIQFMALAQATDCLKIEEKLSSKTGEMYKEIRKIFPVLIEDRTHYKEIEKIIKFLKTYRCRG